MHLLGRRESWFQIQCHCQKFSRKTKADRERNLNMKKRLDAVVALGHGDYEKKGTQTKKSYISFEQRCRCETDEAEYLHTKMGNKACHEFGLKWTKSQICSSL
jgi:hypothetical protein